MGVSFKVQKAFSHRTALAPIMADNMKRAKARPLHTVMSSKNDITGNMGL